MMARRSLLALLAVLTADFGSVAAFLTMTPRPSATSWYLQASQHTSGDSSSEVSRRNLLTSAVSGTIVATTLLGRTPDAQARLERVNRPDLLPKEPGLNVIQVEKFLTSGQAKRMDQLLAKLEEDTGYRLRVLCQVS